MYETIRWPEEMKPSLSPIDGGDHFGFGTTFETNLAGQDVVASVQEFQPMTALRGAAIQGFGDVQGLARLDHHAHGKWVPSVDRGDGAGTALARTREAGTRCVLAHPRETAQKSRRNRRSA